MRRATSRDADNRIAMMAMTTSSSTSVKPRQACRSRESAPVSRAGRSRLRAGKAHWCQLSPCILLLLRSRRPDVVSGPPGNRQSGLIPHLTGYVRPSIARVASSLGRFHHCAETLHHIAVRKGSSVCAKSPPKSVSSVANSMSR